MRLIFLNLARHFLRGLLLYDFGVLARFQMLITSRHNPEQSARATLTQVSRDAYTQPEQLLQRFINSTRHAKLPCSVICQVGKRSVGATRGFVSSRMHGMGGIRTPSVLLAKDAPSVGHSSRALAASFMPTTSHQQLVLRNWEGERLHYSLVGL